MGTMVAAALSAALTVSAVGAEPAVVDVKAVEAQIVAAQGQVAAGNLDGGLKALQDARAKAVTADLVARAAFVTKLAEVRMAEQLGDQAKALAALNEAFAQAKQPDQVGAVWQTGLTMAQSAIAGKGNALPVIDFLANGPGPAMKQFTAPMDLARLRMATGNPGAAEAELRNAGRWANSAEDWTTWVGTVTQLANLVDGGQAPKAGADVFTRLRDATRSGQAKVMLDVAKGRFLLGRGQLADVEALADQIVAGAASDDQALAGLSLEYDLAVTLKWACREPEALRVLGKAEGLAQSRPVSPAMAYLRGYALTTLGQPAKAAELFWAAAQVTKDVQERQNLLSAFGGAKAAAGDTSGIADKLQAAKAGAAVYVGVADAMVKAGDSGGALKLLAAVPVQAFVETPQACISSAVGGVGPLMQKIQAGRQQLAKDQGARVRAIAAAFDDAAKASKDPKAAADLAKQAADLTALATQVEK
jgi:tetratricopeptide (TPR) repeat protein